MMQQPSVLEGIDNSEWISEDEKPTPEKLPRIPFWGVLIRPIPIRKKTKGGIILPDKTKDDIAYLTTVGKVLALGEEAFSQFEKNGVRPKKFDVGDLVVYGKHAGKRFLYQGIKMIIIDERDVDMVIQDAGDIDPGFNVVRY